MQSFKQFLAERERRTADMSIHNAQQWMQQHAMGYLKKGNFLYRGISGRDYGGVLFADPAEGEARKSIGHMANYYTLWMSYNPKWKGTPSREFSFIATATDRIAREWGNPHIIVPADSSKVGAVGENDIWDVTVAGDYFTISKFTTATREALTHLARHRSLESAVIKSYSDLEKVFKSVTLEELEEARSAGGSAEWDIDKRLISMMKNRKCTTMFELWSTVFTPDRFRYMDGKSISGEGEFWIEGPAVFIPLDPQALNEDQKTDLIMWAEDYAPKLADEIKSQWKMKDVDRVDPDTVSARDTLNYEKKKNRNG